jgi:hypothetical protein
MGKKIEKADIPKAAGYPLQEAPEITSQHDEKIFHEGDAIFSEGDLRELINNIYSEYQYDGTKFDRLVELINFLGLESNRYVSPELAVETKKVGDYLDTFWEFLKKNFQLGKGLENGEAIYFFKTQNTSFETEAFMIEFQMVSMDVENAFRNYRAGIIGHLKIQQSHNIPV